METQGFKRTHDPHKKLQLGEIHNKPISKYKYPAHELPNYNTSIGSQTYGEYLTEEILRIRDFLETLDKKIEPKTKSAGFYENIQSGVRDIQSELENMKGILEIYTVSGIRLDEDEDIIQDDKLIFC